MSWINKLLLVVFIGLGILIILIGISSLFALIWSTGTEAEYYARILFTCIFSFIIWYIIFRIIED